MIEVEQLSKSYGNLQAVREISFTAQPGDILGFLGPNRWLIGGLGLPEHDASAKYGRNSEPGCASQAGARNQAYLKKWAGLQNEKIS